MFFASSSARSQLQLLVFGLELFHHIGNDPFEFGTLEVTLLQLILQFLYQLTVEPHAICNELDVFLNISLPCRCVHRPE